MEGSRLQADWVVGLRWPETRRGLEVSVGCVYICGDARDGVVRRRSNQWKKLLMQSKRFVVFSIVEGKECGKVGMSRRRRRRRGKKVERSWSLWKVKDGRKGVARASATRST
jgi:hypothetical protein